MTYLITAAIGAVAVAILAGLVVVIASDGGEPEHPGANDAFAAEVHDLAEPKPRHAAPSWWDLVDPAPDAGPNPDLPQPALVRPYVPQHDVDTVDLARVAPGWMPTIGAARLRAGWGETAEMDLREALS